MESGHDSGQTDVAVGRRGDTQFGQVGHIVDGSNDYAPFGVVVTNEESPMVDAIPVPLEDR